MRKYIYGILIIMFFIAGNNILYGDDKLQGQKQFLVEQQKRKEEIRKNLPQLLEKLKTATGERKWRMIYDLGYSEDGRAIEPLIEIVENENETLKYRLIAIQSLGMNGNKKDKSIKVLEKMLTNEKLKNPAIITMFKLGERNVSLPFLKQYAEDGHPEILYEEKIDISVIPHGSYRVYYKEFNSKQILKDLSNHKDEKVRANALYCLIELGEKEYVLSEIDEILNSSDNYVRDTGKSILKKIGDKKSIKKLKETEEKEFQQKINRIK